MQVIKMEEAGYESALKGLALSFYDHQIPFEEFWTPERREKSAHRLKALAFKGGGHNKALASIFTWFFIQAPRCWWSEYDTYKVATVNEGGEPIIVCLGTTVVSSSSNSASTMHTLSKRMTTSEDYEQGTAEHQILGFNTCLEDYHNGSSEYYHDVTRLKMNLPEGWLQERQVCINYMTLQNILRQREGHRLKMWQMFGGQVLAQVEYPELIWKQTGETK